MSIKIQKQKNISQSSDRYVPRSLPRRLASSKRERSGQAGTFHVPRHKGFSLVELLIAMAVATLIILASVAVFASMNKVSLSTKVKQQNIEDASASLELMAKTLRMGQAVRVACLGSAFGCAPTGYVGDGAYGNYIQFFSGIDGKCVEYLYNVNNKIKKFTADPLMAGTPLAPDPKSCSDGSRTYANAEILAGNGAPLTSVNFISYATSTTSIGRATIIMKVGGSIIQDTASFRDYSNL